MRLDPLTEAEIITAINSSSPPGDERDTLTFRAVASSQVLRRREFFERYVKIQDKRSSEWKNWTLNRPQRHVEAQRLKLERRGAPVRLATLKARQWGMSRFWLASAIEAAIRGKDVPALIIADKRDGAGKHLEAGKRIVRELPYRLPLKRSNRNELVFDSPLDGYVDIGSAEEDNPARGRTYRFVHATEPAFWKDAEKKVRSLAQAVPSTPGTTFSWESTANGVNWWHEFWWAAQNGDNEYKALFFPWWADPTFDYWLPYDIDDAHEISSSADDEEIFLVNQGCDTGSLKWRRWAIRNLCFGDLDSFHQEYPATPDEAFLASGRPVFVAKYVMGALKLAEDPVAREELVIDPGDVVQGRDRTPAARRVASPRGRLSIWKHPAPGRTYVIGADVADEPEGGDKSSALVIDLATMEDVAEWNGNIGPRDFGFLLACLGRIYNEAWIAPEVNSFGVSTLEGLRDSGYPRIMRRAILDSTTAFTSDRLGWCTTRINKPVLIDEIRMVLQEVALGTGPRIRSREGLREMLTMVIDDSGHANAPKGKHDDRVMARGLAYYARRRAYETGIGSESRPRIPTNQDERHWQDYMDSLEQQRRLPDGLELELEAAEPMDASMEGYSPW